MAIKDEFITDLYDVFFNDDEFAEDHLWNSTTIKCIVDDDDLMSKYSSEFELLPAGSHMILVPAAEFQSKPRIASAMKFDNVVYTLHEIKEQVGMYVIFLERGQQR